MFVDVADFSIRADVEGPARGKRLIHIHHAIGLGDFRRGIAQQRVIDAQRLREGLVRVRSIDADREVRRVEGSDLSATLTE